MKWMEVWLFHENNDWARWEREDRALTHFDELEGSYLTWWSTLEWKTMMNEKKQESENLLIISAEVFYSLGKASELTRSVPSSAVNTHNSHRIIESMGLKQAMRTSSWENYWSDEICGNVSTLSEWGGAIVCFRWTDHQFFTETQSIDLAIKKGASIWRDRMSDWQDIYSFGEVRS